METIKHMNKINNITTLNSLIIECLDTMSACSYITKDYSRVIELTNKVFEINANNFYALSIRGKTLIALNKHHEAIKYLKKALSIKYNKALLKQLKELEDQVDNHNTTLDNIGFNSLVEFNDFTDCNNKELKNKIENKSKFKEFLNKVLVLIKILFSFLISFGKKNKFMLILIFIVILLIKRMNRIYFN